MIIRWRRSPRHHSRVLLGKPTFIFCSGQVRSSIFRREDSHISRFDTVMITQVPIVKSTNSSQEPCFGNRSHTMYYIHVCLARNHEIKTWIPPCLQTIHQTARENCPPTRRRSHMNFIDMCYFYILEGTVLTVCFVSPLLLTGHMGFRCQLRWYSVDAERICRRPPSIFQV